MNIKLFKMFESRTQELSEEDFIEILNTKCKDFLKNPKLLQRNKSEGPKFSCIDPKKHVRTSLFGDDKGVAGVNSNHNTLLMDNLPSWSKFPKRSQSIIGTSMYDTSTLFGKIKYFIIPFDGARFAVCPSRDIWALKCTSFDGDGIYITFDNKLSDLFSSEKISDTSYDEMMKDLQVLYDTWLNGEFKGGYRGGHVRLMDIIFKKVKESNYTDISLALNDLLAPSKFEAAYRTGSDMKGFGLMNWKENPYGGLSTSLSQGHEFWTDSECLLYRIDIDSSNFSTIEDNIKQEFEDMIKSYKKSDN